MEPLRSATIMTATVGATAALAAVESNYVETVDDLCASGNVCGSEALIYGSIDGMLHTLDPHSSFMDPKSYAQMRERQEGRYYGLGISIQVVEGDITVFNVFEGSPAYQKGIRRGDVILAVNNQDVKSLEQFTQLMGQFEKGKTLIEELLRGGVSFPEHAESHMAKVLAVYFVRIKSDPNEAALFFKKLKIQLYIQSIINF